MAKSKARKPEVSDRDGSFAETTSPITTALTVALSEDSTFVVNVGLAIKTFVANAATFFAGAADLEKDASSRLNSAKLLKVPTTTEEDQTMQRFAVESKTAAKAAEEYWGITQVLHGWHTRAVAGRKRAVDPNEQAAKIATAHHVEFERLDAERVRREQVAEDERVRLLQEKLQREEQEALEAKALEAEANAPELSKREQLYVDELHRLTSDPSNRLSQVANLERKAYLAAGFTGDPAFGVERLKRMPKITEALAARVKAEALRRQAEAVKLAPPPVVHTVEIKTAVVRAAGVKQRETWSGVVDNAQEFIDAVFDGKHGIPRTLLMIDPTALNKYASDLKERMDAWPGVHAKKTTTNF